MKPAKSRVEEQKEQGQLILKMDVDEEEPHTHIEIESAPQGSLRVGELEHWTRYRCSACGKSVMGYDAEAHIKEKHKGVDVGFLK